MQCAHQTTATVVFRHMFVLNYIKRLHNVDFLTILMTLFCEYITQVVNVVTHMLETYFCYYSLYRKQCLQSGLLVLAVCASSNLNQKLLAIHSRLTIYVDIPESLSMLKSGIKILMKRSNSFLICYKKYIILFRSKNV